MSTQDEPALTPPIFNSIICIPGTWASRDEFTEGILRATDGGYAVVGNFLLKSGSEKIYSLEFCLADDKMERAFRHAGQLTGMEEAALAQISEHKHVVYLSAPTGNLAAATNIAFAAGAVLNAGGLGIKIETAGIAFAKDHWTELLDNFEESSLYKMFVVDSIIDEDGTVYSCGMQNLGFKDTIVPGEAFQDAVSLISIFGFYQLIDKPVLRERQTFAVDATSPKYRITDELNQPYKGDDLFENPFGMWRLTREG